MTSYNEDARSPEGSRHPIIAKLEQDANAYARQHKIEVDAFMRSERIAGMARLIGHVRDWLDERGDGKRLAEHGVTYTRIGGTLVFEQAGRTLVIRPRDDLSVAIAGYIVRANRDCPVLDRACYDEILARIFKWVREGNPGFL